jgi:glycosyltransferase involved in cell wall biosynthesis
VSAFNLTYSVADQNFQRTKSIGILNLSVQLAGKLAERPEVNRLMVLSNRTVNKWLSLPARVAVRHHDVAIAGRLGRVYWDQFGVYRAAGRSGNEWLFLPKGFASFMRRCPVKLVTCVADANHDYYRRHYPRSVPRLESWYFHQALKATIRDSRIVFTISEFTSAEVARLANEYGLRAPVIRTIGIGFLANPIRAANKRENILVLGSRWPHKRTDLAVAFMSRWQQATGYAGTVEWIGRIPEGVRLPPFPGWRRHLRVPEGEYRRLLAEARALVYFSEYEGFGMPPVEATIAGTCPVYSDLPATREVMAGAGYAFSNWDYDSFVRALERALRTSSEQLRAWAADLLKRHNWDLVADRVVREMCG